MPPAKAGALSLGDGAGGTPRWRAPRRDRAKNMRLEAVCQQGNANICVPQPTRQALSRRHFDGFNFPENCMNNKSVIVRFLLAFLALAFAQVSFAQSNDAQKQADAKAQARQKAMSGPPDATADFEGKQLRLIAGGAKGKGVLHYKGKDYPFTMSGVSVGGIGYTEAHGTANIYFLKSLEDFPGTYQGIGAGAAAGPSKGANTFQSMKEVVITTKSKGEGAALNLGVSSVTITLDK